jgi:hypothetical protein
VVTGNNQIAAAGATVNQTPSIRATDVDGNAVSGVVVTFVVTAGGGAVTGAVQTTNGGGIATAGGWTLGPLAAINRLEARVSVGNVAPLVIEARSWSVSLASVALHVVGDSQQVAAKLGADSTSLVTLSPITQSRWLQEVPVADSLALGRGLVRATGPGSIRLAVRAFGLAMDDVAVSVVPPAPLIFSIGQPGWPADPTIAVRGYRMNALPADATVLVGGSPATRLAVDSAQLTANPGLATTTQCVLSLTDSASVPGVASLWKGTVRRPTLVPPIAVGETRTIQGVSNCLKLPPNAGGAYVLAQVDRALIDRAATTAEAYRDTVTVAPYTFSVGEVSGGAANQSSVSPAMVRADIAPKSADVVIVPGGTPASRAGATTTDPLNRATPWTLGEVFFAPGGNGLGTAATDIPWRVMRLYPNHVVFAISLADSAVLWSPEASAKIDSVFGFVLGPKGLGVYQSAFGAAFPSTSAGSGQYLAMLERRDQQGFAVCQGDTRRSYFQFGSVVIGIPSASGGPLFNPPLSSLVLTFAHEYTHSWDCVRTGWQGEARWGLEGIAEFVGEEMERLFAGVGVADNVGYQPPGTTTTWWDLPYLGQFQTGYGESSSFMRHLTWRLSSGYGISWEQARAAVILGSSEGWFGRGSVAGPGLVSRVRQIAGPQWDPVDARLDVILSIAVDDRASGPATEFAYVALKETWRAMESTSRPFSLAGWSFFRGQVAGRSCLDRRASTTMATSLSVTRTVSAPRWS